MKLAFSTLSCPRWGLDEILDNGKNMGFEGVELRGIGDQMNLNQMPEFAPENRAATMARFREKGLSLCVVGTSCSFHDESKWEAMLEEGRQAVNLCQALSVPYIRVFGNNIRPAATLEEEVGLVGAGIRKLCDLAEETNVKVLLEVHGTVTTAPRLLKVAELVGSDHFGILWDVAHSHPVYRSDFLPFYRALRPLIAHVHVKDHVLGPGLKKNHCPIGQGEIPLKAIFTQMEADGYQGFYSLELEKRWNPHLQEPEQALPEFVNWMKQNI